ncbi:MAG: 16S rRNA (uracil(1498)-N(3))-methyltransferase [Deltaproteobacteria bacterium]|nr:16S rRNA (uracil(1498)-N(3))-methyltransferase [Deltaproteobacteria bacterium]
MPSFYVSPENLSADSAFLKGSEARHLRTVLRLEIGDTVNVFDGQGHQFKGKIASLGTTVQIHLIEKHKVPEERFQITLGQALLKSDKMEFVIQKATELGVSKIIPFSSSRTIPKGDSPKGTEKTTRWEKIALAAAKQCGRSSLPEIVPPQPLTQLLDGVEATAVKLILWERETKNRLRDILREPAVGTALRNMPAFQIEKVVCLIGPEGGFSEEELEETKAAGFIPITLGHRILRAETATIVFLSLLQHELGVL